jgi:RNA polymerase sigma factor (sigma-70 family)
LTTIAQRHCYRVKRRQRRRWESLDQVEEEVAGLLDESPLPDEAIERTERAQLVREALALMDEPSRRLLTRLFYEKDAWSYKAIAQDMGLAVATIGPKRGRCLKRLEGILNDLGFQGF